MIPDVSLNHIEFRAARIIMMHIRELIVSNSFETSRLFMRYKFFYFVFCVYIGYYSLRISTTCPSLARRLYLRGAVHACSRHHRFKGPWTIPIEGQGRLKLSSTWGGWKMQMS